MVETYIDLDRKYSELSTEGKSDDNEGFFDQIGIAKQITLHDLLLEKRIIILSEAGTGKTTELRIAAQKLNAEGKQSFFLRLENLNNDLDIAFEVGTEAQFNQFVNSDEECWIFLDSVDEAKLKSPDDFKKALRRVRNKVGSSLERANIIISGRTTMFKPISDLDFCNSMLCPEINTVTYESAQTLNVICSNEGDEDEDAGNELNGERKAVIEVGFKIYRLEDLSIEQIEKYITSINLPDCASFVKEIQKNRFLEFARRPQDLNELTTYWRGNRKLKSRIEVMDFNIRTKLREWDADRAQLPSIDMSDETLEKGAQKMAAACVICKEQNIQIEDNSCLDGIKPSEVLRDWKISEVSSLLLRPLFDEAIYGQVRFHHRSVKEYMCAKWFKSVLDNGISRRLVEREFFKKQFDRTVVIPSRRPVLTWLVLLDDSICEKAVKYAPEIFLEGGDAEMIPLHVKGQILIKICENNSLRRGFSYNHDFDAIRRFAVQELGGTIRKYLVDKTSSDDVKRLLLRMVELGGLKGFDELCTQIALDKSNDVYLRILAIRSLNTNSNSEAKGFLREHILSSSMTIDRGIIAELAGGIEDNEGSIVWLIKVLQKAKSVGPHEFDGADRLIANFVQLQSESFQVEFLKLLSRLLGFPPYSEHVQVRLSKRHKWLLPVFANIVTSLVKNRELRVFDDLILTGINMIGFKRDHNYRFDAEIIRSLKEEVKIWRDLSRSLYWNAVENMRRREGNLEDNVSYGYSPMIFGCFAYLDHNDFDYFLEFLASTHKLYIRNLALDLSFDFLRQGGLKHSKIKQIDDEISDDSELKAKCANLRTGLESSKAKRPYNWEIENNRRHRQRETKQEAIRADSSAWLRSNLQTIKKNGSEGAVTKALIYLFDRTRKSEFGDSKWASTNWQKLIALEGEAVAEVYRDALIDFWKKVDPQLKSQKEDPNQTGYNVILGLSGIGIQAKLDRKWLDELPEDLVIKALRFGMCELNGFPFWFEKIAKKYPTLARTTIRHEMEWAMIEANRQSASSYPFHDLVYHGKYLWHLIAPDLFDITISNSTIENGNLGYIMKILLGSGVIDANKLIELAKHKLERTLNEEERSFWTTQLISFSPEIGIKLFQQDIKRYENNNEKSEFVQRVISGFGVGHYNDCVTGQEYKKPKYLRDLYLISHQYVRVVDDIERSGKGSYSPGLRDHAQDARSAFFEEITSSKGFETYKIIRELEEKHPIESYRDFMKHRAKKFAEDEAETGKINEADFIKFAETLQFMPKNEAELFELVKIKLEDLKDDFQNGDNSPYKLLRKNDAVEEEIRQYIARELRNTSKDFYSVGQEDELADDKRPDIRIYGKGFDSIIPIELKIADNWSGQDLIKHLQFQVYGDYLRDRRSNNGIYLLIYKGIKSKWELDKKRIGFVDLILALNQNSEESSNSFGIGQLVKVIGIDLTKRQEVNNYLRTQI